MMRNRVGVILFLALVSGLLAAYLAFRFLRQPTTAPIQAAEVSTVGVMIAARDLPVGHLLQQEDMRVLEWPVGAVPDGFARDPSEVVGRGLIASVRMHEPLLFSKISGADSGYGLELAVQPGMRATAVRVNEVVGVAGWMHEGQRVDVIVTLDQGAQMQDPITQIVLQDVEVLRIGAMVEVDDKNEPYAVTVVTLHVDPEESERLTLAETKGQIRLALRNPLDRDTVDTQGVMPRELVGGRRAATNTGAVVRRPAGVSIEIISGTTKSSTTESGGNSGN
jgi:pilus assembly protein CpaB